jgi:hypothetical protein
MASSLSGTDQTAAIAAPRVDDEQNQSRNFTKCAAPVLTVVAPAVAKFEDWTVEDQPGVLEVDSVFGKVREAFLFVLFERHGTSDG